MERLAPRDLHALLDFLRETYTARNRAAFATYLARNLPRVVPSEQTGYVEVSTLDRPPVHLEVWEPHDPYSVFPRPVVLQEFVQHPFTAHFLHSRTGRAVRLSDLLSQPRRQRLVQEMEVLRFWGTQDAMGCVVPIPPRTIALALNRSRADFTERERLLLDLLRPHLSQARRNAEVVSKLEEDLALLRRGLEAGNRGVVVLGPAGRVRVMTPQAREWLTRYFGTATQPGNCLFEALGRWVRHDEASFEVQGDVPPPRQPLVVERDGSRLVVRMMSASGQHLLLLEEQQMALAPASLESFGLSRREAEVLAWVAEGKTNAEIGVILGARPRTVAKHLERIYQKLGVETRTAAARMALAGRITN